MTSSTPIDSSARAPMDIRVQFFGRPRSDSVARHVVRKLERSLGRFRDRIQSLMVRVRDVNGRRGGVDQQCSLALLLQDGGQLHLDDRAERPESAVNRLALARAPAALAAQAAPPNLNPPGRASAPSRRASWPTSEGAQT